MFQDRSAKTVLEPSHSTSLPLLGVLFGTLLSGVSNFSRQCSQAAVYLTEVHLAGETTFPDQCFQQTSETK